MRVAAPEASNFSRSFSNLSPVVELTLMFLDLKLSTFNFFAIFGAGDSNSRSFTVVPR